MTPFRRAFDGKTVSGKEGSMFVVYEPAVWQFWRWLWFWIAAPSGRCEVQFEGEKLTLRVVAHTLVWAKSREVPK